MNGKQQIKRDTLIRHLSPSTFRHVVENLNIQEAWKNLACQVRRRDGELKFDLLRIQTFERSTNPAKCVMDGLCHDNVTVGQLVDILTDVGRVDLAHYLSQDFTEVDVSEVPGGHCEQGSSSGLNCQNDHDDQETVPKQPVDSEAPGESPSDPQSLRQDSSAANDTLVIDAMQALEKQRLMDEYDEEDTDSSIGEMTRFTLEDLRKITDNFNPSNRIGVGGFGEVFRGKHKGKTLAVKRLKEGAMTEESVKQFYTEVQVLSRFIHENLLPLAGYCATAPAVCVVYMYMSNGSLEDRLARQGGTPALSARCRVSIAQGVARGINYLHTGVSEKVIIHRDIKSANVLLDKNFTAKLGDCGLAHRGPSSPDKTSTMTHIVIGTSMYMAPEYLRDSKVSIEMDTYSYGVVLLELLTGLPAFDMERDERDLKTHVDDCDDITEMIDSSAGEWEESIVTSIYKMSERCFLVKKRRPKISEVLSDIEQWSVL